jgi:hypothetical protein
MEPIGSKQAELMKRLEDKEGELETLKRQVAELMFLNRVAAGSAPKAAPVAQAVVEAPVAQAVVEAPVGFAVVAASATKTDAHSSSSSSNSSSSSSPSSSSPSSSSSSEENVMEAIAGPVVDPVVENTAPVVENAAPVVENAAPGVENAAPVVENAAPVVENAAPGVENAVLEESVFVCDKNHESLQDTYKPEGDVRYAKQGNRFFQQPCWACHTKFNNVKALESETVPSIGAPVHCCVNKVRGCSKLLCNGCYTKKLLGASKSSRRNNSKRN